MKLTNIALIINTHTKVPGSNEDATDRRTA